MTQTTADIGPYWTTIGYCRPLLDYLRRRRLPLAPILSSLGVREEDLRDADCRVDNRRLIATLALAEELCADPNIGLHIGRTMQVHHLGLVGVLVMNCTRVEEIFELHSRYESLVGNGLSTRYRDSGEELCMEVHMPPGHPPLGRQDYEFNLSAWLRLTYELVGEGYAPLRVELPYARPEDDSEQRAFFRAPLSYEHDAVRIYFPSSYRQLPLMGADPALKQALEVQARKRLQDLRGEQVDADPQLAEIRRRIAEELAYGVPTLEQIADDMQLAVRTLQRQLDSRSSSFSQLLEQVRMDLARQAMAQAELSLVDVALMLGFAEQSSFARAFKRWFGTTPGAWRKQVAEESPA